jgi:hypothetical protein
MSRALAPDGIAGTEARAKLIELIQQRAYALRFVAHAEVEALDYLAGPERRVSW